MGIAGALSSAVSGLQAQAFALEQISGNIANSQTVGFKRTDASFQDFVSDGEPKRQVAKGVMATSRSTNNVQGDVSTSAVTTHMAINGSGYFLVEEGGGSVDGEVAFAGADLFTRRGDFELDTDGYLRNQNGSGYYLKGYAVDPTTGNVTGGRPEPIKISNDFLEARASTEVEYRANLPAVPKTSGVGGLINGSVIAAGGVAGTDIAASESDTFLETSIAGGGIEVYDGIGSPIQLQLRWAKIANTPATATSPNTFADVLAGPPALTDGSDFTLNGTTFTYNAGNNVSPSFDNVADLAAHVNTAFGAGSASTAGGRLTINALDTTSTLQVSGPVASRFGFELSYAGTDNGVQDNWNLFYLEDAEATGATVMWKNTGANYTFANGALTSASKVQLGPLTVNGVTITDLELDHGENGDGLTQQVGSDSGGAAEVTRLSQDGYAAGKLRSLSVTEEGRVRATFSNGQAIDMAQVAVATFNAENRLKKLDGGAFEATAESGFAILSDNGSIQGSALEASNTDISEEFAKLIVTQQAYSANSRIISTSAEMLREVLDVVR